MKAKINNGLVEKFPYSLGEMKKDYPNIGFPRSPSIATFESYGVYQVTELAAPSVNPATHKVVRDTQPVYVEENIEEGIEAGWKLSWTAVAKTAEEIDAYNNALIAKYTVAIQKHLDSLAKDRGYDSILSACTYPASKNPTFATEGTQALALRDDVWTYAAAELPKFISGERAIPTVTEFLAELPVWGA